MDFFRTTRIGTGSYSTIIYCIYLVRRDNLNIQIINLVICYPESEETNANIFQNLGLIFNKILLVYTYSHANILEKNIN